MHRIIWAIALGGVLGSFGAAASFDSGSNGSDGAFNPGSQITIDLSLAGSGPGTGIYDPALWVVIFNYTTINIPSNVDVFFTNHPSGAPVVWLASGDVAISGRVWVWGAPGNSSPGSGTAGPGGFEGGQIFPFRTAGFGPGGAHLDASPSPLGGGGGYGAVGQSVTGSLGGSVYGSEQVLPLIGGSGGAASNAARGGGGGGAILVASSGSIVLDGFINAGGGTVNEYSGGGSGGAIRLLANFVSGAGQITAYGGSGGIGGHGGLGRARVEAVDIVLPNTTFTFDLTPGPVFQDTSTPSIRITTIAGEPVSGDPEATIGTVDVTLDATGDVDVGIEAMNVPVGTTVQLFIVKEGDADISIESPPLVGSLALSTTTVTVPITDLPALRSGEMYVRANW